MEKCCEQWTLHESPHLGHSAGGEHALWLVVWPLHQRVLALGEEDGGEVVGVGEDGGRVVQHHEAVLLGHRGPEHRGQ